MRTATHHHRSHQLSTNLTLLALALLGVLAALR
jgi:hypothetical protein